MKKVTMFLLATALGAATLVAQRPFGPRNAGEGQHAARTPDALIAFLNLDDAQVTALQENNKAFREAVRTAMEGKRDHMKQLRDELAKDSPDANLVGQLIIEGKKTREQIGEIRDQYKATAMQTLTDEQKAKLASLEQVTELQPTAREAAGFYLLDRPDNGPGFGPGGRGRAPTGRADSAAGSGDSRRLGLDRRLVRPRTSVRGCRCICSMRV